MGRLVAKQLAALYVNWICVDPNVSSLKTKSSYDSIDAIPIRIRNKITHIFICVPTQTHQKILNRVLRDFPNANIMLEKPVCAPNDYYWFRNSMESGALKNVWVNNHYIECNNTHLMNQIIKKNSGRVFLEVGFYKNRLLDNAAGRFIDTDYYVWGYEGFHMLTIAAMLLPSVDSLAYLDRIGDIHYKCGEESDISWVIEDCTLESGNRILLKSSTNGADLTNTTELMHYYDQRRSRKVLVSFPETQEDYNLIFGHALNDKTLPGFHYSIEGSCLYHAVQEENPLRKHIEKFLTFSLNEYSSIDFGLKITRRLMHMAKCTYQRSTSCD